MSIKDRRESIIRVLDSSQNKETAKYCLSNNLFDLGLSMYSSNNSIDSILVNSFNSSVLDKGISLHEEQIKAIAAFSNNDACVVSAPTSFGKTFCVFEYIARSDFKTVVLIVPTLALAKEYLMSLTRKYSDAFQKYKIHINIDENIEYDFSDYNLFILTHERAITNANATILPSIDLLVIDEVYKLDISEYDERSLIFNIAYKKLAAKANKYILLAPFIGGITKIQELEKRPYFFKSDFSPVINDLFVFPIELDTKDSRFRKCFELYNEKCRDIKSMIYFPGPSDVENYVRTIIVNEPCVPLFDEEQEFLRWAEDEFGPDWSVCLAIKRGYLINHGKMPSGVRDYLLSLFNKDTSKRDCILCTSTLLEGVNTATKKLIIVKAARVSMQGKSCLPFKAFDFYNLIGRTGRLNQYYIGESYYIKSDNDIDYCRDDAEVTITFEITEKTRDIDIQINQFCNDETVINELRECGLTIDDFVNKIGSPIRFSTFKKIKDNFNNNKDELLASIHNMSRHNFFKTMNNIVALPKDPKQYGVIKKVLESRHRKTKDILEDIKDYDSLKKYTIDQRISLILNIKNNYLEHTFLNRCKVVKLICDSNENLKDLSAQIGDVFIKPIEEMYYLNSTYKKMLKNIGVYDSDIDKICSIIGTDYKNINEMKDRLTRYKDKYFDSLSFISKFAIDSIL